MFIDLRSATFHVHVMLVQDKFEHSFTPNIHGSYANIKCVIINDVGII